MPTIYYRCNISLLSLVFFFLQSFLINSYRYSFLIPLLFCDLCSFLSFSSCTLLVFYFPIPSVISYLFISISYLGLRLFLSFTFFFLFLRPHIYPLSTTLILYLSPRYVSRILIRTWVIQRAVHTHANSIVTLYCYQVMMYEMN